MRERRWSGRVNIVRGSVWRLCGVGAALITYVMNALKMFHTII